MTTLGNSILLFTTPRGNRLREISCCVLSCSVMSDSAPPWTVAHQAPLSMEFSRKEYWSGLSFPTPGDLSNPGSNLYLLSLLHWQANSLASPGKPHREITFAQSRTTSQCQGWRKSRSLWWKLKFLTTYHRVYFFFFFFAIKCPHDSLEWGQSDPGVSPSKVSSVSPLPKENGRFQKFRKLLSDLCEDHLFKGILETVSNNVLPFKISSPEPQCLADSNYRHLTVLEILRFFDLKTQSL